MEACRTIRLTAACLGAAACLVSMASPALPHVRTSGSDFNMDGLRAAAGSVSAAVGDYHYVQAADGMLAVYRKHDGFMLRGPFAASALFAGAGGQRCAAGGTSHTEVLFDHTARRWIVAYRTADHPALVCLAVSDSGNPAGSYHPYVVNVPGASADEDLRLVALVDGYYFSIGAQVCGIDRQALLREVAPDAHCHTLSVPAMPVVGTGELARAGPALFLGLDGKAARLLLWRFSLRGNRLRGPQKVAIAPFQLASLVSQPIPGAALAAFGDRLAPRPVVWNGAGHQSLVATHPVLMTGGQLGLRWYDIALRHGAPTLRQQGSFAPDGDSRWMASIGVDKAGDMALAYAITSPDTPPGIRYTGRERGDAAGRMQAEEVIFNGNGVQPARADHELPAGELLLDPVDRCTFWYTQRYLPSTGNGNWHTRITRFKFEACR